MPRKDSRAQTMQFIIYKERHSGLMILQNHPKVEQMPSMLIRVPLRSSLPKVALKSVFAGMLVKSKLQNSK